LEVAMPGWAARVPVRIHGEHGRDANDPDGHNRRYQRVRRLYAPFVHRWIALSQDLGGYLTDRVGIDQGRISQIYNGVDVARFEPAGTSPVPVDGCPFDPSHHFIVGTVGRMAPIKDQLTLARAFITVLAEQPALRDRLRLVLVGEGPLRVQAQALLEEAGVAPLAWLPGERRDVPAIMRGLHAFVLPSLGEGISNTILEAMACGLPVLATRVGGNAELVADGDSGIIVPSDDPRSMAAALAALAADPAKAAAMGRLGRQRVEQHFSLTAMVDRYEDLYQRQLQGIARH
jgi:sugar transferase (PEP-CTERM/EpsH1 system associated)